MGEFSLLTLNTFGLPLFLGWWRLARLMKQLDQYGAAVLCFQEIQQNAYVPLLERGLPDYQYYAYESNWFAPKGGLFTAAREPMEQSGFIAYENRGRPFSAGFADWALNKGVLMTRVQVQGRHIVVMNTHLHANYAGNWTRDHSMSRIQRDQVRHLAQLIREQPADALVIACGDFNFPRGTFLYDELIAQANVIDPLAADPRPTYRPFPLIPKAKWSLPIDFCFVRLPAWQGLQVTGDIIEIQDDTKPFAMQRFLTDHNALTLKATWTEHGN